jgi:hypothetical protein
MFHLYVLDSTSSLPLYFSRATTSSLPPHRSSDDVLTHAAMQLPPPPWEAGAGHLEAACHLFFYLSHRAPPPSLSCPPSAAATESSSEQFAHHTASPLNSLRHHVHHYSTPEWSPTRATPHHWSEPRPIFFSLGVHSTVVSALLGPGHHGFSLCYVRLILCSLYYPDTHRPSTFLSRAPDMTEHVLTTEEHLQSRHLR